jgi:hypothetical protein
MATRVFDKLLTRRLKWWPKRKNRKSTMTKNAGKLLAILITMRMRWYNTGRIPQWWHSAASSCIAPAAVKVIDFELNTQKTLPKHNFS